MKKILAMALSCVLALSLVACGGTTSSSSAASSGSTGSTGGTDSGSASTGGADGKVYKIAVLVPFIGDQSYFDSVNAGRKIVEEYPNVETTLIEMTMDKSKWEGYYVDAAEGGYDLIIGGNNDAEEFLYGTAEKYPDQLFFNFDYVNHRDLPNVFATMYNTPQIGYMAGTVASLITQSSMENANADKKVGIVLGMDIPAMNDFAGSYAQAVVDNGAQMMIGYPESFTDSAKAKEIAMNMYKNGVDIVWQVAGGAGVGVFEAALESKGYSIGVDSDQTISMAGKPFVGTIVTSMFKDCGASVVMAVDMLIAGNYPSGTKVMGLEEGGVGLINNEQYQTMVPEDIRTKVEAVQQDIISGKIVPLSALNDQAGWEKIKAEATGGK